MIKAQIYDVFCDELAQGNPCGVVELNHWLSDSELLKITHQVAQPVTSFVVQSGRGNQLMRTWEFRRRSRAHF